MSIFEALIEVVEESVRPRFRSLVLYGEGDEQFLSQVAQDPQLRRAAEQCFELQAERLQALATRIQTDASKKVPRH